MAHNRPRLLRDLDTSGVYVLHKLLPYKCTVNVKLVGSCSLYNFTDALQVYVFWKLMTILNFLLSK